MIPLHTTLITVKRSDAADEGAQDPWGEGYPDHEDVESGPVATGVRAVISIGSAATVGPGQSQASQFSLTCDPCDLNHLDVVVDQTTGDEYEVDWALSSPGIAGLACVRAGLSTRS